MDFGVETPMQQDSGYWKFYFSSGCAKGGQQTHFCTQPSGRAINRRSIVITRSELKRRHRLGGLSRIHPADTDQRRISSDVLSIASKSGPCTTAHHNNHLSKLLCAIVQTRSRTDRWVHIQRRFVVTCERSAADLFCLIITSFNLH